MSDHRSERRPRASLNDAYYFWRRNSWLVDPRFYLGARRPHLVDRPVFFLGNQGDGLTLVSRMIRHSPHVVSLSGDSRYWSGADEMQRAMLGFLPAGLSNGGRLLGRAPRHPVMTPPRSWSYASDALISGYRRTADDASESDRRRLLAAIAGTVRRHGGGRTVRFVDKSQTFTVRLGYVNALLAEVDPFFVLITRNPFATIYRAATGKAGDMERYRNALDPAQRLELCTQHWINSIDAALADAEGVANFTVMAFEDFLSKPKVALSALCSFLHLEFDESMIPRPDEKIPFGTRFEARWFPLRADVNEPYLEAIPDDQLAGLVDRIGDRAAELGYRPPVRR